MTLCLVTGATGYIGGRLVPRLLEAGHEVRCMARSPGRLRDHDWYGRVQLAEADATRREETRAALEGVEVAFYLIHTMASGRDFAEKDREAARIFARAAAEAGVRRIVYLGGLSPGERPSPHMRSRAEVERILLDSPVPAVAYRASMIIGSGSVSFEMLRYLTERLPAMTTPRWVRTRTQPIAIRDVLRYLVAAVGVPGEVNRAFDIGGPDVMTYADMMQGYAAVAGLPPRLIIPVAVLTPRLSSYWVGLVTPVPSGVARPLVESLRNEAVCREHDIARYVPDPPEGLIGFREAVMLALRRIKEADVVTRWSSASTPGAPSDPLPTDPDWAGGSLYVEERGAVVDAPPEALWRVIEGIGGDNGWYSLPGAWRLRGLLDRVVGGVGLRRGRRDPARLRVGDALDFWRVEEVQPGRLLRLRAEMLLPGLAWLELTCRREDGRTVYGQRAIFHPHGLLGHLYWQALRPFHGLIFGRMPGNVAEAARALGSAETFSSRTGMTPGQTAGEGRPS
ncbi:SDR family oxidoreductase [Sphaerisporangium fuscum]|uniref:SDR family oxidoreductase n=1 Tax=Sphaerisporangium fuscum TaxID=2835868 RepID=UPI001BDC5FC8|nr:SDR family oxidoreductase [Sphaerisporangium fuscum]